MPQHSLATLRIPPRLTCECLYVTLVLQHKTTRGAPRNVAQSQVQYLFFILLRRVSAHGAFPRQKARFGELGALFRPGCPVFLTHTIHSCVVPRCGKALLACCSCKLPPWLDERERPRDTERGRGERVEKPYKAKRSHSNRRSSCSIIELALSFIMNAVITTAESWLTHTFRVNTYQLI